MLTNLASQLRFRFDVNDQPGFRWTVQQVMVPPVGADPVYQVTPFYAMPRAGNRLSVADLRVTLLLDEALVTYTEIISWMYGLAPVQGAVDRLAWLADHSADAFDANLTILSSHNNPLVRFRFPEVFPVDLGDVKFLTTSHGVPVMTCQLTFATTTMEVTPVSA